MLLANSTIFILGAFSVKEKMYALLPWQTAKHEVSLLSSYILYTKTSHGRVLKLSTSNHRVMYSSHIVDEIFFEAVQLIIANSFSSNHPSIILRWLKYCLKGHKCKVIYSHFSSMILNIEAEVPG